MNTKQVKKIIVCILFLISTQLFKAAMGTPQRLALYPDTDENENPGKNPTSYACTAMFNETVKQQACSIIVSQSILKTFVACKSNSRDSILNHALNPDKPFDFEQWVIYHIKASSYFLFIPKQETVALFKTPATILKLSQLTLFTPSNSTPLPEFLTQLKTFVTTHHKRLTTTLHSTLAKLFITAQELAPQNPNPASFTTLEAENSMRQNLAPWNIFIMGHGSLNNGIAGITLNDFSATLRFFNDALNTHIMFINSCFIAGSNEQYMESYKTTSLKETYPLSLHYKLIIGSIRQEVTLTFFDSEDKSIAIKKFFETLEIPNKKNNLEEALQYLSLSDDWFSYSSGINSISQILIPRVGWKTILPKKSVEIGFLPNKKESTKRTCLNGLKAVIIEQTTTLNSIEIMPFEFSTWIQWAEQWKLLTVNDNRAPSSLEKNWHPGFFITSPIMAKIADYRILWLLKFIAPRTTISYCYPQFVSQGKPYHLFNTIFVHNAARDSGGVLHFLRDAFLNIQGNTQPICWFIKELHGFNDITPTYATLQSRPKSTTQLGDILKEQTDLTLHDVAICAYKEERSSDEPICTITIMFKYANNYYRMQHKNINLSPDEITSRLSFISQSLFSSTNKPPCVESLWQFDALSLPEYEQQLRALSLPFAQNVFSFQDKIESDAALHKKLSTTLLAKHTTPPTTTKNTPIFSISAQLNELNEKLFNLQKNLTSLKKALTTLADAVITITALPD